MSKLALLLLTVCACRAVDIPREAESIRRVENTARHVVGRAGERSDYQFTYAVWSQHSALPFYVASLCDSWAIAEQKRVALAHCEWLKRHVKNPTPYRIALAWNAGADAVNRGRVPQQSKGYARRVQNVYEDGSW